MDKAIEARLLEEVLALRMCVRYLAEALIATSPERDALLDELLEHRAHLTGQRNHAKTSAERLLRDIQRAVEARPHVAAQQERTE